ncbi:hypothetical protein [Aerosakkonema funiforme]|uniref:hypothetical protein n=1 Tax=Aerosakkonema funiforme TaxID=1246630 RepID=UPI0035BA3469
MEIKQLPDGLKNQKHIMEDGVKQWSRLVAWSWTDYLAFGDDEDKKQEEQKLKEYFIKIFQDQARYSYTFISYGDKKKKGNAYVTSLKIKKLVLGKNSEIGDDDVKDITLTLPEVYEKLTNQRPEALCHEPFMQMFHAEVITDRFSGYIRDISDSEKEEIKEVIKEISENDLKYVNDVQYIIYFAYPPCPAFSKATVTEEQLIKWMQGKNENGDTATDYLPPSAYIPISMS